MTRARCQGQQLELTPGDGQAEDDADIYADALAEFDSQGELLAATTVSCGTAILRYDEMRAASVSDSE